MRIKKFLQQDIFKEEFSHTILHNKQIVFANPDNLSKPIIKQSEPLTARGNVEPVLEKVEKKPAVSERQRPNSQLQKDRPVGALRYKPPQTKESKHQQMVEDMRKKRAEENALLDHFKMEKEVVPSVNIANPIEELIGQATEAVSNAVEAHGLGGNNNRPYLNPFHGKFVPGDSQRPLDRKYEEVKASEARMREE
jgi:hypothetical protein